jgi:hypothetical protein
VGLGPLDLLLRPGSAIVVAVLLAFGPPTTGPVCSIGAFLLLNKGKSRAYAYGNPYGYGYQSYSYGYPSSYGYAPYGTGYYGYAPSSYNYGYSGYSSGYTPGYYGYGVRRVARGVARRAYYRR